MGQECVDGFCKSWHGLNVGVRQFHTFIHTTNREGMMSRDANGVHGPRSGICFQDPRYCVGIEIGRCVGRS